MAFKRVQLFDKSGNTLHPQAVLTNIVNAEGTLVNVALDSDIQGLENTKASLAGADFTGVVTVQAPTADTHASTKKYVDDEITSVEGYIDGEIEEVEGQVALKANSASPTFTGTVTVPELNDSSAATAAANKGYVDAEIAAAVGEITAAGVSYEVVEVLPEGDAIKTGYIYLLKDKEEGGNVYEEYMYINGKWEIIGTTVTDLEGKASLSGASFTGAVTVPVLGESAGDLTVTNKGYVDGAATAAKEAAEATAESKATAAKEAAIAAAASDATEKAGTAKSEAIAAAASDATEKANAAQAAAEATAAAALKGVTDQLGELGTVVYYKEVE